MSAPRNVLLVTYDCVRSDVAYRACLPGLRRLRESGVTFNRAISAAPLTPVSHATIFTGVQPYRHGVRHMLRERLAAGRLTLAQHLARAGFDTAAVVACAALSRWYGLNRGFRLYDDAFGTQVRRATDVVKRGQRWLAGRPRDKRWLLFLHFFDAHRPYDPPGGVGDAANAYEAEIHYLDGQLDRLLDWLEGNGLLDETLVVVFADHGEDLDGLYPNDKGGVERGHPEEFGHGCLLYEQTQHVPLVFAHPSLLVRSIDRLVGLVDIAPTVCALLGVPRMPDVDGLDIVSEGAAQRVRRALYAETLYAAEASGGAEVGRQALWLDERYKIIRPWGDDTRAEVFDLVDDPCELRPLRLAQLAPGLPSAWPNAGERVRS